jgi:hypothetical protein
MSLLAALDSDDLKFMALFSSSTGRFAGPPGGLRGGQRRAQQDRPGHGAEVFPDADFVR